MTISEFFSIYTSSKEFEKKNIYNYILNMRRYNVREAHQVKCARGAQKPLAPLRRSLARL